MRFNYVCAYEARQNRRIVKIHLHMYYNTHTVCFNMSDRLIYIDLQVAIDWSFCRVAGQLPHKPIRCRGFHSDGSVSSPENYDISLNVLI